MMSERRAATLIGVLYIIGTVSGVLSLAAIGSITSAPDYLAQVIG